MINTVDLEGDHIVEGDILEFLKSCSAGSFELVSAFHVAEHLSHLDLRELIAEVYRVLIASGSIILETPNPENLAVSSWAFWMDPTHVRPIPPFLLCFLLEDCGFHQPFLFRLNGALSNAPKGFMEEIFANLFLSAPDYAVIAEKQSVAGASSAWRAKLSAITQPRPADTHRLLTNARGVDQIMQGVNTKFDDRVAARIEELRRHWDRTFDLNSQRIEALNTQLDKDREITDLKFREFILTLGQKLEKVRDEVEELKADRGLKRTVDFVPLGHRDVGNHTKRRKLSALIDKRWRRLKNSIKKRLPASAQEKAVRRWKKLKRSIIKRLPIRSGTHVVVTKDRLGPHSAELFTAQARPRSSEATIAMLNSVIVRHSTRCPAD